MVCIRCKMVVKVELAKLGLHYTTVELGEVEIMETISAEQQTRFREALLRSGLELMDDKKSVLIQKIKNVIIELIHYNEEPLSIKLSELLGQKLNHDYTYLANLFSEVQGTTIEKFFIAHKIERVKELLVYDELNLTEIAYLMHYSSVAHLSTQFKKITGLTPSHFKLLRDKRRSMLEDV
jgi:AraC-like DNA-binding protein